MRKGNYIGFFGGENVTKVSDTCFSNFFRTPITITLKGGKELRFTCSEQLFMWFKAKYFGDNVIADKIYRAGYNPKMYKRLGRQVRNYNDDKWNAARQKYMYVALKAKFKRPELHDYLLRTGDSILVEASPFDNIWACGLGIREDFDDEAKWTGQNLLGKTLMQLRAELDE